MNCQNKGDWNYEKSRPIIKHEKKYKSEVSEAVKRRENTILSILLNGNLNLFQIIKENIKPEDFRDEINQEIAKKLYEEFEKGNSNINGILDNLDEEKQNHITKIMADDYEIVDFEKAIDDIMQSYEKEKLNERKFSILEQMESDEITQENKDILEKELSEIIIRLAKIK